MFLPLTFATTTTPSIYFDPLEQFEAAWVNFPVFWGSGFGFIFLFNAFVYMLVIYLSTKMSYKGISMNVRLFSFFKGVYQNMLGTSHQEYVFLFYALFIFMFLSNLMGLAPYSYTTTSYFLVTTFLSCLVFCGMLFTALQDAGMKSTELISPANVPTAIYPVLTGIELISYFMRAISLSTRLFANMVAGHALLKILLSFLMLGLTAFAASSIGGMALWILIVFIACLEIIVAFLQAYVFVFLGLVYLSELKV